MQYLGRGQVGLGIDQFFGYDIFLIQNDQYSIYHLIFMQDKKI